MSYSLFWRSPALPYVQKQTPITVPAGTVVSNASSLRFTGKGAANYGKIQQENLMRLLENHAGPSEPAYPTVGQTWFDTSVGLLKVATATAPLSVSPTADWRAMNATYVTNVGENPPASPVLGDQWFMRTGTKTGVLYTYTGIGRYPAVNWDAHAAYLYPPVATTNLGIILNSSTFAGGVGSNYYEAYIHGFSLGVPADVAGSVANQEVGTVVVPSGMLATSQPGTHFIVYDISASTLVSLTGAHFFCVRKVGFDKFEYDNNGDWVPMPSFPNQTLIAIGSVVVGKEDDNLPPGLLSAEVWTDGIFLERSLFINGSGVVSKPANAIGGWSQVWPGIETTAGRAEYEEMYNTLMGLIGSPYTYGGSNALGKSVNFLTDMFTFDGSLLAAIRHANFDPFTGSTETGLPDRVQPDSQDWDRLLAAARYAVNRLELPSGSAQDIASIPFVQDGLPLPPELITLPSSDVRAPSVYRHSPYRRYGAATMLGAYSQTVNMLDAATQNRYMLRGILGNSGTNTSFNTGVQLTSQQRFQAPGNTFSGSAVTHGMTYQFMPAGTSLHIREFFCSGEAVQINIQYAAVGTSTDTNFSALVANVGQIRVLADQVLVMSPGTQQLTQAPISGGYLSLTTTNSTLATFAGSGCSIVLRAQLAGTLNSAVQFFLDIVAGGTLTATVEVQWKFVEDTETYNAPGPVRVYPAPQAYDPAHKLGSTAFTAIGT